MTDNDLFLIAERPGFTPEIGRLVSMMNYVRFTTMSAVAGLSVDELDYVHDSQSNSIGALLSHIASAEVGYQAATFHARDLNDDAMPPHEVVVATFCLDKTEVTTRAYLACVEKGECERPPASGAGQSGAPRRCP